MDGYLSARSSAPIAVALSGGGDSMALLHLALHWCRTRQRTLHVLTIDHGLSPDSGTWTQHCADIAADLGLPFQAMRWSGPKPTTGLPAAARAARHALLAEAARRVGARVILMGHTADDCLEAQLMRQAGNRVGTPELFGPSPVWPEGRNLFLCRPLLPVRRDTLRRWLSDQSIPWIEDPANADQRFARSRARLQLATDDIALTRSPFTRAEAADVFVDPAFGLIKLTLPVSARILAMACLSAAGTTRPPRQDRLSRLQVELISGAPVTATLAGARIERQGDHVLVYRESGELARRGLGPTRLAPGHANVWDGRFEIMVDRPGWQVVPLRGVSHRLSREARERLSLVPRLVRPALPVLTRDEGTITCPILAETPGIAARSLISDRFHAAIGIVNKEPDD